MHRSRGAINLLWQQRLASSALSGGAVANNTKRVVPILQMHSASSPPPPAMEVNANKFYYYTVGQKIKKVQAKKNSRNQINQFHEIFFDQIPFFKNLKLPKMQFHKKKCFDLFDFTSFFASTIF